VTTQISAGRLATPHTLAVTATSAATTAFDTQTRRILVSCTAACNIAVGKSPIATTSSTALPAGVALVIDCNPGEALAAVTATSATLSATELT
jgi:hypothetical protein